MTWCRARYLWPGLACEGGLVVHIPHAEDDLAGVLEYLCEGIEARPVIKWGGCLLLASGNPSLRSLELTATVIGCSVVSQEFSWSRNSGEVMSVQVSGEVTSKYGLGECTIIQTLGRKLVG